MQLARVIRIERDLQRANPAVLDVEPALVRDLRDPLVVEAEASNAQVEQRSSIVSLDVGASMPADACVAPPPGGRGSTTVATSPRTASSRAIAHPMIPAPTVVDSRPPGGGATQASAGMLAPYIEAHDRGPLLELGIRSLGLYDEWIANVRHESRSWTSGTDGLGRSRSRSIRITRASCIEHHCTRRISPDAG